MDLVQKNLIKVKYESPLHASLLFDKLMCEYTVNHIFARFLDTAQSEKKVGNHYYEPIVYNKIHNVFLVEYSYLIEALSDLVDNKIVFKNDYKLDYDYTKNSLFLITSVMEDYCRLLKMNNKTMNAERKSSVTYMPSFVKLAIIRYQDFNDDSEQFLQMNAVVFSGNNTKNILTENIKFALDEHCAFTSFSQLQTVFGAKKCSEFWQERKRNAFRYDLLFN